MITEESYPILGSEKAQPAKESSEKEEDNPSRGKSRGFFTFDIDSEGNACCTQEQMDFVKDFYPEYEEYPIDLLLWL